MRNIALVPERNVLESGLRVRAHHAGKSTDLLASNWIPLVRHRRRAFLFFAEIFFYFADFGTLKMANFRGDFVERAGYHGKSSEISRMAVALNNLRRNCGSFQSQARADFLFQLRAEVGKRADCPGELSYAHVLRRALKASDIALCFGIPVGQLDSKSKDRKSTRLNSSHPSISYAVFCLKKKTKNKRVPPPHRSLNRRHLPQPPPHPLRRRPLVRRDLPRDVQPQRDRPRRRSGARDSDVG